MKRYFVPVLGMFPVWKFGPRYNLFGEYVDDGWYPNRFLTRGFETSEDAEAFINAYR